MKIDNALKLFSEKYNKMAIQSIEEISNEFGLNYHKKGHRNTIKGFTIKEGFDSFLEFITGYVQHQIDNKDVPRGLDEIKTRTKSYINEKCFKECDLLYSEIPSFVESYVTGIKSLIEFADGAKKQMIEANLGDDDIGSINEFMDEFVDKLNESFDPAMNKILWASGYNSKIKLAMAKEKKLKPVFL